jgi:hypothetical protein
MTLNYPDEDHWTWQRFIVKPRASSAYYRVPPGERASESQRAEWREALAGRPDLLRRLLDGQPGVVMLGQQVALGFNEDLHVATGLKPIKGEPLFIGQDGGHTPCTIIGQVWRGHIFVYAALTIDRGGMRQQYETNVLPWLATHAPWAIKAEQMIRGCYDPAMPDDESDSDRNPMDVCIEMVGGTWEPGPVAWESRKNALITALNKHASPGLLSLAVDSVGAKPLVQALSGRWYYPENRIGDAFCYFVCVAMPEVNAKPREPLQMNTFFDARQIQTRPLTSNGSFDPRRRMA